MSGGPNQTIIVIVGVLAVGLLGGTLVLSKFRPTSTGSDPTPSPSVTETSSPGVTETSSPGVTEMSSPGVTETGSPGVTETGSPGVTETGSPGVTETGSPGACNSSPKQEAERFSSGERSLFSQNNLNLDLKRGIEEFNLDNYAEAAGFFEKAMEAARNDPEPKIYFNNATARAKGCPLRVAVVVPVTSKGTSAQEILRGVADAQNKFNKEGGEGDRLLEVIIVNDGNDSEIAKKVAAEISEDVSILGVIGHNSSRASEVALPFYQQKGVAMISPTSTSTELKGDGFFRAVANNAVMAQVMIDYVKNKLKSQRVVIFYDSENSYSKSLLQELKKGLDAKIIMQEIDINPPDFDVSRNVNDSIDNKGDTAILLPSTETTSVAMRIINVNGKRMRLLGGDALYLPTTLIDGGNNVENMVLVVPVRASSVYESDAEKKWGGSINWRTVGGFDAAWALIEAMRKDSTRQGILDNLGSIEVRKGASEGSWRFEGGERSSCPVLVIASKSAPAPKDAKFGFALLPWKSCPSPSP